MQGGGGKLIVAVSTDAFNWNMKQKRSAIAYADRAAIVAALKCVDKVIPEESWEQKLSDIQKYHIDLFVMGCDWDGQFDFLKPHCEVIYLPRTEGISSSLIKAELKDA